MGSCEFVSWGVGGRTEDEEFRILDLRNWLAD